jgi:hypothetical protein
MNAIEEFAADCDHSPKSFAAELTEAVFPVALRYGVGDRWLDLELDLWHVLADTVEKWSWKSPADDSPGRFEGWRNGLLAELAEAAYHSAIRHGTRGSLPRSRTGLYQAFRSAIGETVGNCQQVAV